MIKINFEINKDGHSFKVSIVLPVGHGFTDAQIETIKQQRFDDWLAIINAPQEESEE